MHFKNGNNFLMLIFFFYQMKQGNFHSTLTPHELKLSSCMKSNKFSLHVLVAAVQKGLVTGPWVLMPALLLANRF